jgi:hypothetical protein
MHVVYGLWNRNWGRELGGGGGRWGRGLREEEGEVRERYGRSLKLN